MSAQDRIDEVASAAKQTNVVLFEQLHRKPFLESLGRMAPDRRPEGLAEVAFRTVMYSEQLGRCSVASIVRSVAEAAKLGLNVDGVLGQAYLVPFRERGKPVAQMMVGYRGFLHMGYASGRVARFHGDTIHENDEFRYAEGVSVTFHHQRALDSRGAIIGAYALAHLDAGGPPLVVVMGMEEIEARRDCSSTYRAFKAGKIKSTPWQDHFRPMAVKTCYREMGKKIPYPTLQAAALRDEARDEGRAVPPSAIDLEPDEVEITNDERAADGSCGRCGRLQLNADGTCPDCDAGGA